ncbi:MAG: RNA polymerase sigma factor [Deltaproteobacteria bacterium]|nr:RNA polymerase sigma factor [Deltaproteobacteria bacterium]
MNMQHATQHTPCENGDREIVRRIRMGDEFAVSEMYRKYARYVAAIAYRLMGNDTDLDDIVQDTFVSAVQSIGGIKDSTVLKTWIGTIAFRNTSRYVMMRQKQKRLAEEKMHTWADFTAPGHSVSIEVEELMSRIPYKYRAPWILSRVMDMNLAETSEVCNCSVATTKRRIGKADTLIRRMRDDF